MDIFGTISAAIGLVEKVKAIFDQVDQNKDNCVVLSTEIVESLLSVQQFWKQNSSCPPAELEDGLSKFESDLRSINASLAHLLKPARNGTLDSSIAKLKEIYNVNEIKNELVLLDRKVQRCHRELQARTLTPSIVVVSYSKHRLGALFALRVVLPPLRAELPVGISIPIVFIDYLTPRHLVYPTKHFTQYRSFTYQIIKISLHYDRFTSSEPGYYYMTSQS
ncbi:hypothetical protein FRC02_007599, partial [Tulasnella sp. 418]